MDCFLCKSSKLEDVTTHVADLGNCIIIIKKVPCLKCEQCGEISYTGIVVKQLERIIDTLQNTLTEIAVVNYLDRVS